MITNIKIIIKESLCKQCGVCKSVCPNNTKSGNFITVNHSSLKCDQCLHCFSVCPNNAILLSNNHRGDIEQKSMQYDHFIDFIKYRRSTRRFQKREISGEKIEFLLDSTRYAPSGGNDQGMSITVVQDIENRRKLEHEIKLYYKKLIRLMRNPVIGFLLRLVGNQKVRQTVKDRSFLDKISWICKRLDEGENNIFYDAPVIMIFHSKRLLPTPKEDCIISAYNVVLSAETLGLGSCFVSLSQHALDSDSYIKKSAGINKKEKVHIVLVLGYPLFNYLRYPYRRNKHIVFN